MADLSAREAGRRCIPRVLTGALLIALLASTGSFAAGESGTISVTIPAETYQITNTPAGQSIVADGFGYLLVPGKPALPSKIFAVAIPPGTEVVDVRYEAGAGLVLPGRYDIRPAPLPRVIGAEDAFVYAQERARFEANYASAYGSDDAYPSAVTELVRTAGYRKYNLVDVRVTPFAYRPQSGELTHYPEVTVHVDYRVSDRLAATPLDNMARTEKVAREIVYNYDDAQDWYPQGPAPTRGLYDFVIITLDSLESAVAPLESWEIAKGRTVAVVTVEFIDATYAGVDLAAKMRTFLHEKYPEEEWGIQDVLLVGSYDDVPMRRAWQDVGYGMPETDYYYAELSLPDDQSWDDDQDGRWGEDSDPIDFYAEVNVGRIPWSNYATVEQICQKSVAYEQNYDPAFKQNILLLGSFFWSDTDNAVMMEAKVDQPWMTDWSITRLYEQNSTVYSSYPCDYELTHSNVMSVWPNGTFSFVNLAGHGSPTSTHIMGYGGPAFISSSDCPSLSDDYPAIVFADACSNSDTDYLNIGQAMLQHGAVGFLGATKVAYGVHAWSDPYDGSSQSFDYFFTTCVTSGDYTQGAAQQWSLREMYTNGLWYYSYYEMFEWGALWGNPDLVLSVTPPVPMGISFPNGRPELLAPGVATTIALQITEYSDTYVADSGQVHYRYDGGSYSSAPFTEVGDLLYEVVLPPAACSATPEYYFSIEGATTGVLHNPLAAPVEVYSALVGEYITPIDDNFETDLGWTAENLGATSGEWQRGIPVDDATWNYDPPSDGDGSGSCYLTQNEYGNTDVDDGAVRLLSPILDMSGGDFTISYDYYLHLTRPQDDNDLLLLEISSNGDSGPWTQIARHNTHGGLNWRHHVITPADLDAAGVAMTDNMQVRFTANDADAQSINEAGVDAFKVNAFICSAGLPGDMNCDGVIDFEDINPFVAILGGEEPCSFENADVNGDGEVDFGDINPFVALLAG